MKLQKLLRSAGTFLFICLIFAVVLSALIHAFVFCINWEDWFFGTKLDGPPAGLFLFFKAAGAAGIGLVLGQYPRYQTTGILMGVGYFGILFFNSAATFQKTVPGTGAFPVVPAILFAIPALLLVIHLITSSQETGISEAGT